MFAIVQHPIDPSTLARYRQVLCALRISDIPDHDADRFWDQAASALELPTPSLQHQHLDEIARNLEQSSHMEVAPCRQ
jgi:hypothetical protein